MVDKETELDEGTREAERVEAGEAHVADRPPTSEEEAAAEAAAKEFEGDRERGGRALSRSCPTSAPTSRVRVVSSRPRAEPASGLDGGRRPLFQIPGALGIQLACQAARGERKVDGPPWTEA